MAKTVVGLFPSIDEAQAVKHDLVVSGYSAANINVVAHEATANEATMTTAAGAGAVEPGIGERVSNFFRSLTGSEPEEAGHYAHGVSQGGAMLAVTVPDDEADDVERVLEERGARNVGEQSAAPVSATAVGNTQAQTAIPVIEEQMELGKRQVQRGGVRVYSHVTEKPVEANVLLREERVRVERRPVDRVATEADLSAARDHTIELTEMGEEAVVGKTSRVVEEVIVGKEVTEHSHNVHDTVRKTEVHVEQMGGAVAEHGRAFADYDSDFRQDFQTNYANSGVSYDRYAPAYQYGYTLANDPRYSSSDWSTVESQARGDWASHGQGTWDEFKAAVRHGWDRVRGK